MILGSGTQFSIDQLGIEEIDFSNTLFLKQQEMLPDTPHKMNRFEEDDSDTMDVDSYDYNYDYTFPVEVNGTTNADFKEEDVDIYSFFPSLRNKSEMSHEENPSQKDNFLPKLNILPLNSDLSESTNFVKTGCQNEKEIGSVDVYFKPSRKKMTKYSKNVLPTTLCSSPYWYSCVISYPNTNGYEIKPKFYIKVVESMRKCQKMKRKENVCFFKLDYGIKVKEQICKDTKKRSEKKVRLLIDKCEESRNILMYLIQIDRKIFKKNYRKIQLFVEDELSGDILYRSGEIDIFSRKQYIEDEFWLQHSTDFEKTIEEINLKRKRKVENCIDRSNNPKKKKCRKE